MQEIACARSTGELVRAAREAAGLTQSRLAEQAGVALRTVIRIEQGFDATIGTLRQIAVALGVAPAELIGVDK